MVLLLITANGTNGTVMQSIFIFAIMMLMLAFVAPPFFRHPAARPAGDIGGSTTTQAQPHDIAPALSSGFDGNAAPDAVIDRRRIDSAVETRTPITVIGEPDTARRGVSSPSDDRLRMQTATGIVATTAITFSRWESGHHRGAAPSVDAKSVRTVVHLQRPPRITPRPFAPRAVKAGR